MIVGPTSTTATTWLRFKESRDVAHLVSDRCAIDSAKWAADIQPSLPLQHFHAAAPDGGINVFVNPRPRNGWDLGQIDESCSAAHIATAIPVSRWQI